MHFFAKEVSWVKFAFCSKRLKGETMHQRSFRNSFRSSSQCGTPAKMFFVTGRKVPGPVNEKRSIYQRFLGYELMDKKRTETALKAGEDRAILLGLSMVLCSIMMYFVLCITMVRSYTDSVWTEESICTILNSSLTMEINCSYSCGPDCWRSSKYPCLQVYVSINATGRVGLLSHNEETQDISSECFYVPKCQKDHVAVQAMMVNISEKLKAQQQVRCFYDPAEQQSSILLSRLYGTSAIFHSLFWPSCMLAGGSLIIFMVKLTQYLSILCEHISKMPKGLNSTC
ncbi:calcium-activated potassium channel subunit beta-2-like [Astyanax mexicanus]|uniref:Calcium-activated potassium channel subunit beta-2-like n=3 Tax=Astyanax mexicanus TaxID=7994 RepID=A0A8T2LPF4_ASTMX|nr:calcium-activated potassium channel subunit beta-2-like [Astyanax mexicanus]